MRARPAAQPVQAVRRRQHLRARPAAQQVQGVRQAQDVRRRGQLEPRGQEARGARGWRGRPHPEAARIVQHGSRDFGFPRPGRGRGTARREGGGGAAPGAAVNPHGVVTFAEATLCTGDAAEAEEAFVVVAELDESPPPRSAAAAACAAAGGDWSVALGFY